MLALGCGIKPAQLRPSAPEFEYGWLPQTPALISLDVDGEEVNTKCMSQGDVDRLMFYLHSLEATY